MVPRISLFARALPGLNRQADPGKLAVKLGGTGADQSNHLAQNLLELVLINMFYSIQLFNHAVHGRPLK